VVAAGVPYATLLLRGATNMAPTTVTLDLETRQTAVAPTSDAIADAVWDELLTGALHTIANSAGKTLRGLSLKAGGSTSAVLIHSGTAQAGTASTITLDTGAIATNDIYNGALILITGSTGVGQSRKIIDYVGSTKVATVTPDFVVNPTGTSTFEIYASTSDSIIAHEGQAQAGAATTITLDTGASAFDDVYNGSLITLTGGLGSGQTREITDYNGTTKVTTVAAWSTNPDSTTVFAIIPSTANGGGSGGTAPTVGEIANGIWDELQADHVAAGTFGEIATEIADIPTTAEFEARTLVAASYFDPAADAVANVTLVATTTDLTNLPSIPANWLTAAGTAADFTTEIQSGLATAASIGALNDIAATDIVSAGAITTLAGAVVNVDLVDTTTTNTDMVAAAPTAVDIADQVWDEAIAGHVGVGSTGEALTAAGAAGDPWATALPGAYGAGTAGLILGTTIPTTIDRNAYLTESQRGGHTWQGNYYFVDPVNGDTHASGNRGGRLDPYSLVQDCHDNAVTDSNHDVIFLVAGDPAALTTLTEDVTLSKRYLFIRGPGRDFLWTRSGSGDTISITADGIELSGFQLETAATGSGSGIDITDADFLRVHNVWINDTQGDGIHILRGDNCQIYDNYFINSGQSGAGQGIDILGTAGSSNNNIIKNNIFRGCAGDGIQISGGTTNNTKILGNVIEGSTGWGIDIGASAVDTVVADNRLGNNTSGSINDGGTTTVMINNEQYSTHIAADVWTSGTRDLTAATNITSDGAAINVTAGVVDLVTDVTNSNPADVTAINGSATAAARLALSANEIIPATVDTVINTHTPTNTEFQADDVTEATASHFNGRIVIFTSGVLDGQATDITGYSQVGGIGQFTVTAMTEAPADNDTFIIV